MKKILEKIKNNNTALVIVGFFILGIIVFFTFSYDIGLNSKYFVKRDFSKAFLFRQTGNCEEFVKYLNQDWTNWVSRCYEEKNRVNSKLSIKSFQVNEVTTNGGRAFLQVELKRDSILNKKEDAYVANYEMIRINGGWLIDQLLK